MAIGVAFSLLSCRVSEGSHVRPFVQSSAPGERGARPASWLCPGEVGPAARSPPCRGVCFRAPGGDAVRASGCCPSVRVPCNPVPAGNRERYLLALATGWCFALGLIL